jgi:osmotically-inducible protein OsmY
MDNAARIRRDILAALEHETRVNLHEDRLEIEYADGIVTLSGEVENIAAKRLALEAAAALPKVEGIVDRLRTRPSVPMGDGEIADHLEGALRSESSFDECALSRRVRGERTTVRERAAADSVGRIEIVVEDGVVTLDGEVPSLSHKRLAGTLAWWVPGSRDVINGLGVEPPEEDNDDEILDALRLVLEKDRLVDAAQVGASCASSVVTLRGLVSSEAHRELVEFDAWTIFGVDDVVNELQVGAA